MKRMISVLSALLLLALTVIPAFAAEGDINASLDDILSGVGDALDSAFNESFSIAADAADSVYTLAGNAAGYADLATATEKISGSVVDNADLLTDGEEESLKRRIAAIREEYDFDIVIVTTPSTYGKDIVSYTDDLYDYNGYGVGENKDGMMFCINMNDGAGEGNRDYYTSTTGFGITAFTDYAIADSESVINAAVLPYLADGDWDGAFNKYLSMAEKFLAEAKEGKPYDTGHGYKSAKAILIGEVIAVGVAVLVAFLIASRLKASLNTAVVKTDASDYAVGGAAISQSYDRFRTASVTRTKIQKDDSGTRSGGGSSTHFGSSGTSHGGGGGKF